MKGVNGLLILVILVAVITFGIFLVSQPAATVTIESVVFINFTETFLPAPNVSAGQFGEHFGNGSFTFTDVLNLEGNANLSPICGQGLVLGNNVTGLFQCVNISDAVNTTGLDLREAGNNLTQAEEIDGNNKTQDDKMNIINTSLIDADSLKTNLSSNTVPCNGLVLQNVSIVNGVLGGDCVPDQGGGPDADNFTDGITFDNTLLQLNLSLNDKPNLTAALLLTQTFLPHNFTILSGTYDSGNITSLQIMNDGEELNVSEDSGADPLTVIINFTNVTNMDQIVLRLWYQGGQGHEIEIGLWDHNTDSYEEEYGSITDTSIVRKFVVDVIDPENHIEDTNVSLRLRHVQNGNSNHDLSIDYTALIRGVNVVSSNEHDALTGRNDIANNHPSMFFRQLGDNRTLNDSIIFNNVTVGNRIGALETLHNLDNVTIGNALTFLESSIGDRWNITQANAHNVTMTNALHEKANQTEFVNTNASIYAAIGGKINISGGHVEGNLTIDYNLSVGSTLFVDELNNRVGIGITNPSSLLDIDTGATSLSLSKHARIRGSTGWYIYNNTNSFRAAFLDNGTHTSIYGDGAGDIPAITIKNRNVGIGTATPSEDLHILNSDSTANLLIESGGNFNTGIKLINPGQEWRFQNAFTTATFRFRDQTAGTNPFSIENGAPSDTLYINSTGKVGIGTTTPGSRLHAYNVASANDVLLVQDSSGTCEAQPTTTGLTWSCSSDISLKHNITNASSWLEYVAGIPLFDYTVIKTGERVTGWIAQEMLKNYPELVVTLTGENNTEGNYSVSMLSQPVLIKAIQELKEKNDVLESTVINQDLVIQTLETRITELERLMKV